VRIVRAPACAFPKGRIAPAPARRNPPAERADYGTDRSQVKLPRTETERMRLEALDQCESRLSTPMSQLLDERRPDPAQRSTMTLTGRRR
jgi:hypothetical protein